MEELAEILPWRPSRWSPTQQNATENAAHCDPNLTKASAIVTEM